MTIPLNPRFGQIIVKEAYHSEPNFQLDPTLDLAEAAGIKVVLTEKEKTLGRGLPVMQTPEGDEIFLRFVGSRIDNPSSVFTYLPDTSWRQQAKAFGRRIFGRPQAETPKVAVNLDKKSLATFLEELSFRQTLKSKTLSRLTFEPQVNPENFIAALRLMARYAGVSFQK